MTVSDNQSPEPIELSEQDQADIAALHAMPEVPEDFEYHPILMVWREILKPARTEALKKVTPQWASRICAQYQQVTFADMNEFRDRYYAKIEELFQMLLDEIASDDNCLVYDTPAEDLAENVSHYKNLLRDWQVRFMAWEVAWDCTAPDAALELAAISEVHKAFFGQTGVTQFLDNIKLELDEEWQAELSAELESMKEGS
jgi:hypothetical protein